MYCPNCGKQLPDKTVICTYCGAPTGENVPAPKNKTSAASTAMSVAGFIVALIALVSGVSSVLGLTWDILKQSDPFFNSSIFFLPIIGLVLALVGRLTGKTPDNNSKYKNIYAKAGIIMGIISIGFALIYCLIYFTVAL